MGLQCTARPDGGECDAVALVHDVVVVPRAEQHGRRARAPRHHEARKVRDAQVALDVDRHVHTEAERDEREADVGVVGREGEEEEEDGADAVRRDRVQVRLDGVVPEPTDDLRHEECDGLNGHAQTDFDPEPGERGGHGEDLQCVLEDELLVDDGGRVHLDTLEGDLALFFVQKPCLARRFWEVEEREDRDCTGRQGRYDWEGAYSHRPVLYIPCTLTSLTHLLVRVFGECTPLLSLQHTDDSHQFQTAEAARWDFGTRADTRYIPYSFFSHVVHLPYSSCAGPHRRRMHDIRSRVIQAGERLQVKRKTRQERILYAACSIYHSPQDVLSHVVHLPGSVSGRVAAPA